MRKRALIALSGLLVLTLTCCKPVRPGQVSREGLQKQTSFMMDTYVTIYAGGPEETAIRAIDLALDRMQELDGKLNPRNSRSPLYAFNHQGVPISDPEVYEVVRAALRFSRESNGAFDITIFPLSELWGFTGESPRRPHEEEIKACLRSVGYQHLLLTAGELQKDQETVRIDLGGIAKGYAVAEAVKVLRAEGITSALVDAGGDVYALGRRDGRLWKVGVQAPRGEDLLGYLEVEDLAVMGSGDYERFFTEEGQRYHHILDPQTGFPAQGLAGITVISRDPMLADGWATALFVMGPEKGLQMANKIDEVEAIMVTTSGELLYSSGLENALKVIPRGE